MSCISEKCIPFQFVSCGILRPLQKSPSFGIRNPNTGFRLFSPQIPPNFTRISP
ncbi:TPA: hypothetical protein ACFKTI_10405 [Neisseria gonorrhoeae]